MPFGVTLTQVLNGHVPMATHESITGGGPASTGGGGVKSESASMSAEASDVPPKDAPEVAPEVVAEEVPPDDPEDAPEVDAEEAPPDDPEDAPEVDAEEVPPDDPEDADALTVPLLSPPVACPLACVPPHPAIALLRTKRSVHRVMVCSAGSPLTGAMRTFLPR